MTRLDSPQERAGAGGEAAGQPPRRLSLHGELSVARKGAHHTLTYSTAFQAACFFSSSWDSCALQAAMNG